LTAVVVALPAGRGKESDKKKTEFAGRSQDENKILFSKKHGKKT
jgi:hypothetical protein